MVICLIVYYYTKKYEKFINSDKKYKSSNIIYKKDVLYK